VALIPPVKNVLLTNNTKLAVNKCVPVPDGSDFTSDNANRKVSVKGKIRLIIHA
jgi:hypothetical protein